MRWCLTTLFCIEIKEIQKIPHKNEHEYVFEFVKGMELCLKERGGEEKQTLEGETDDFAGKKMNLCHLFLLQPDFKEQISSKGASVR